MQDSQRNPSADKTHSLHPENTWQLSLLLLCRPATLRWQLSSSCSTAAARPRLPKQHQHTLPAAALLPPTAAPRLRRLAGGRQSGQAEPTGRGFQPQQM